MRSAYRNASVQGVRPRTVPLRHALVLACALGAALAYAPRAEAAPGADARVRAIAARYAQHLRDERPDLASRGIPVKSPTCVAARASIASTCVRSVAVRG